MDLLGYIEIEKSDCPQTSMFFLKKMAEKEDFGTEIFKWVADKFSYDQGKNFKYDFAILPIP